MSDPRLVVRFADYPFAFGSPSLRGLLRASPADFVVEEQLGFAPDGEGAHVMLWVEKTGANTEWVARQLAKRLRCRPMDVGFCGMKDRNAVTRQWFSVPAPADDVDWQALGIEGARVLEAHPHRRKLRRGAHRANRFTLTLRDVAGHDDLDVRVERVRSSGVPNLFGPQRFGRSGDNVERAVDGARGGIYLSAARSFLFNEVLAARVARGDWNRLLPGEAAQLDGSGSFFVVDETDDVLQRRLEEFDIHPSGPLWGRGEPPSRSQAALLERDIVGGFPTVQALLENAGMRQERRALRLPVRELAVRRLESAVLVLAFELPPGAFATSVLRELIHVTEKGESDAGTD